MDIFGILDPDPHENLCGSETLLSGPGICQNCFFDFLIELAILVFQLFVNFLLSRETFF